MSNEEKTNRQAELISRFDETERAVAISWAAYQKALDEHGRARADLGVFRQTTGILAGVPGKQLFLIDGK
jgi:hypothetical protein